MNASGEDVAWSEAAVDPHRWWDRRMSAWSNLRFCYWLPLLCLVRGHRFDWYDVVESVSGPVVEQFGICATCVRTADRLPHIGGSDG